MYRVMAHHRGRTIVLETFEKRFEAKQFASSGRYLIDENVFVTPRDMFIKEVSHKNLCKTDPFAEDDIELPF